jgi:hypothetical protein
MKVFYRLLITYKYIIIKPKLKVYQVLLTFG